ncbi:LytR/AlgR family response regulator transcription factor [Ekhidna sp.]
MNISKLVIFWGFVWVFLTLFFRASLESITVAFCFVSFLMPVAIATSLFFNHLLTPKYLLTGRRMKFILYFTYMLIVSIYFELLVMVLAFVILGDYQISNLGKVAGDIYLLTVILYLIVFAEGIVLTVKKLNEKNTEVEVMKVKLEKENQDSIMLKVDRKKKVVLLLDIRYIESLSDYVKVHVLSEVLVTKEKISSLEEKLSGSFIRIHRSFLVNKVHVDSHSRDTVFIHNHELPVGRKYKQNVIEQLESSTV